MKQEGRSIGERGEERCRPHVTEGTSISHDELFITDPDAYQMYQSDEHVYSAFSVEESQDAFKSPFLSSGIHEEQDHPDEGDAFIKSLKPGPNGYQEIPLELAQNYFDITELEDQACSSTGRTKFRMTINGQEMIIDGTVTPVDEYRSQQQPQQQQQTISELELEEDAEEEAEYSVMRLPESVLSSGQSIQMITLPDGQLALEVTQIDQKPQMAQVVTVDEDGNIISTDGTFALSMSGATQAQGATVMSVQTDEFGNMFLQEESAPSTSTSGNFHCMEVTGDPAEIAAMYPGMQMLAVNADGTLETVFEGGLPVPTAQTTYVNAKQYHRIMKRREARARLEASGKVPKIRSKYLHESRHLHACNRVRGEGGKFNSKKEMNTSESTDGDHMPVKRRKKSSPKQQNSINLIMEHQTPVIHLLPRPPMPPYQNPVKETIPALKARNPTPLTIRTSPNTDQRPTAVITHLPLPPHNKARPPGFRVARPSEIKKLLPTTYSKPGSTISKVDTLPDKILEESPSNSNSPPYSPELGVNSMEDSDFSKMK